MSEQAANIYVGSDRSQFLATKVLEHSIRRHTNLPINFISMHNVELPDPVDIRQGKRTGFSFTRFAIPKLANYHGKAVYLDADMLVFRDFRELWNIPFNGAKIIIQEELPEEEKIPLKIGSPKKRIKQCSVMLLDCEVLTWDPIEIIKGLDGKYTYEELLYYMCILSEKEIYYGIPFQWNSLESYEDTKTGLIHYTDMHTQPWVSPENSNGHLWLEEVRLMIENKSLSKSEIEKEIELGYFRPSLLVEIEEANDQPVKPATREKIDRYNKIDKEKNFIKHKDVYEAKKQRSIAVQNYTKNMLLENSASVFVGRSFTNSHKSFLDKILKIVGSVTK